MDRFSPVAPAAIRVQVLPVGNIERSRFQDILTALRQNASIVKLTDVDIEGEEEYLLSPKKFPQGSLLLSYTTFASSEQEQQLSPFELFREPLLVIGITDGLSKDAEQKAREVKQVAEFLRERHPRVVHRHLLLVQEEEDGSTTIMDNATPIENLDAEGSWSVASAMCAVARSFLHEFTTYAKAMQASPNIPTPGRTGRGLQRTTSLRSDERRPKSGYSTPTQSAEVSSPTAGDASRPSSRDFGSPPPATSFDQIQGASGVPSALARSDSRTSNNSRNGNRASSQDRVSVQGFGSGTSHEKSRNRAKARVGIVLGHIHLMAGQWSDALRILVEHTNTARKLSDHLWHAKGLEGVVVCLLLLAWAGAEFSIPSICYPIAERTSSAHVSRFSVNLPTDFRPAEAAHQASVRRLSTSLPDLLKQILGLYTSSEGSLELPFLLLSEAKIRFCELLTALHKSNGELSKDALTLILGDRTVEKSLKASGGGGSAPTKTAIAGLVAEAQPGDDDGVPVADHIKILTGIYGVYASLGMDRKKGLIMNEMVARLTAALNQARKVGAAEAGIHPSATLSTDSGADSILAIVTESRSVAEMTNKIAQIYGIDLLSVDAAPETAKDAIRAVHVNHAFGNGDLKVEILRSLVMFCEAAPDPRGVLRVAASILRSAAPYGAVDLRPDPFGPMVSKDDQLQNLMAISRTIGMSKQLGLPDASADYWDPYLLRGVEFIPPDAGHAIIHRRQLTPWPPWLAQPQASDNPLLYNPNASRPGTAVQAKPLLVRNEPHQCVVTLQNPLEVSIQIERVALVTTGNEYLELKTNDFVSTTLGPLRFQQVYISVSPTHLGDFTVTGCRIKLAGCHEQFFPIVQSPWAPSPEPLVKYHGEDARDHESFNVHAEPKQITVPCTAVMSMPFLELDSVSVPDSSLMMLDGEQKSVQVVIRNTSKVPAAICKIDSTQKVFQPAFDNPVAPRLGGPPIILNEEDDATLRAMDVEAFALIQPGENLMITFHVFGKPGVSRVQLELHYRPTPIGRHDEYVRLLSIPFDLSVDASLRVLNAEIMDVDYKSFVLSFDLGNVWAEPLSYQIARPTLRDWPPDRESKAEIQEDGVLAAGATKRIHAVYQREKWMAETGMDERRMADAGTEKIWSKLLTVLRVRWGTWTGEGRWGEVDLSNLGLTPEHFDAVRMPFSRMSLKLFDAAGECVGSDAIVEMGSFVTLRVMISSSKATPPLLVEAIPKADERQLAVVSGGSILKSIPAGGNAVWNFVLCPLVAGVFGVTVRALSAVDGRVLCEDTSSLRVG